MVVVVNGAYHEPAAMPPYHNDHTLDQPVFHTSQEVACLTWNLPPIDPPPAPRPESLLTMNVARQDEDQPMMAMGSELYDDPVQLLSSLPERTLLSDFVESETHITKAVSRVKLTLLVPLLSILILLVIIYSSSPYLNVLSLKFSGDQYAPLLLRLC